MSMKGRIVIKKLSALNRKELKTFRKRVLAKVQSQEYQQVAEKVIDGLLEQSVRKPFTEASLAGLMLPAQKVNTLLYQLHLDLVEFLKQEWHAYPVQTKVKDNLQLLEFYGQRGLQEFFATTVAETETSLAAYGKYDAFYFQSMLKLKHLIGAYFPGSRKESLQMYSDALDDQYIYRRLLHNVLMLNEVKVHNAVFDMPFATSIERQLNEVQSDSNPVVAIWKLAFKLNKSPKDMQVLGELEQRIKQDVQYLDKANANNLFTTLTNCLRQQDLPIEELNQKYFEYFQFQNQHDLLTRKGYFPQTLFNNYVTIVLRVKGAEAALQLIEENQSRINPETRTVESSYLRARCHYHSGDMHHCIEELKRVEKLKLPDLHLNLARRRLSIMSYHEINRASAQDVYEGQPERAISAMRKYLHVNKTKLGPEHERANLDFTRFVNRLTEVNSMQRLEKLRKEIENTKLLPEKKWLLTHCR